ncbi:MAG: rod shape-determining protein RodA [Luminiphilus sp.]|nr:rod shape-determining protein RodA [Luminiphilus sp.]MBL6897191.1 rod shape-determining protein RodA [Luminiphilus sp.]MDA8555381.1 rod shape-determining protein RodA [Luminiphilus sp.]
MSEYARYLDDSQRSFARPRTLAQWLHLDLVLLLPLCLIMVLGLFVLFSASDGDWSTVSRQLRNFVVGWGVLLVVAQVRIDTIQRWSPALYFFALGLLLMVLMFGVGAKGAQRWLSLGIIRFQPSEVMKVAMPLAVAYWVVRYGLPPRLGVTVVSLLIIGLPAVVIGLQPDLGTALLVAASGVSVIFMAGISWWQIMAGMLTALAALWPAWLFILRDYQKQRILTLFDPEADKLGAGWNIIQSKTAIGSGGWSGKGWLQGTQSHLDFLPESQTDFIIAVLAEEWGFRGVLCLLALYGLVVARGFWISLTAQSTYGRLLASAITLTFCVYVVVNMGMVAGLLPVVGVPLPFVSFGGTAIVTLMLGFGILTAISTEKRIISQ